MLKPSQLLFILLWGFVIASLSNVGGATVHVVKADCQITEALALSGELQEDDVDYLTDSGEFLGHIEHFNGNIKVIQKAFDVYRTQYQPPYVEREPRPPRLLTS